MQLARKTLEHLMSGYRQGKDSIDRVTAPAKRVIDPVMTPIHNSPDSLVKGVINLANYLGERYTQSRLKGIKKRIIPQQSMNNLFEQLLEYASVQEPESTPESWRQLSTNLGELREYAQHLRFDTVMRKFLTVGDENYTTEIGTLIEKVNGQLSYTRDISIIIDPDYLRIALKDRTDFMGKKLAPSLLRNRDLEFNIRQALTDGDIYIVGQRNVNIVGDSDYCKKLQPFFRDFANPTLEQLAKQEKNALEEYEEVANSTQIGIATARGNLRGVKNVIVYVGSAYALANTAILLARNSGIDVSPAVTNAINSLAITAAMYIPSANEVMEIAGEIKADKFYRLIKAYEVGREKGDLTLYRKTLADFSSEEIFKPFQGIGFEGASVLTAVSVSTGLTETPWVFALTNSLQVSMNNWFGNIVMWYNNHFKPLVMERRRELVAKHPEMINYFGLEAIVDPKASDHVQDINKLNPRIMEYLPQFRDVNGHTTSSDIMLRRQNIEEVTESEVMSFMGKFNNLTDAQKRYQLMWLANKYSFMLLKDSFSRQLRNGNGNINEVNGSLPEVTHPDRHYYIGLGKDIFKSIGLPLPTPGYSELRLPEGSFFNRSFPYMNVYIPAMWFLTFERIASLGYSPVDIINKTNIDSLESILYAIGAAIIAQGVLTAGGAADTALAGWGAAKEIIYEMGRKAKKYLSKVQLQLGLDSLEGKNNSVMYEIPMDTSYHSHHKQLEDLLIPLSEKNRLRTSRVLKDSDDSSVVQQAYGKFFNPIYITAIREQGQDSFKIFANRELGDTLAQYRLNPAS